MLVNKITVGFVVQVFDTEKKRFVSQEFVAGDQCDYEDNGEPVDREMLEVDGKEAYLPFDMVQPHGSEEVAGETANGHVELYMKSEGGNDDMKNYALDIDGQAFRAEREMLLRLADHARRKQPWQPAPGDGELLEGLAALTDEIADQAHDRHGIDCLLEDDDRTEAKWRNFYRCPQCGHEWKDDWDSQCDDDCPKCGCRHVSPYKSEEIGQTDMPQHCKTVRLPVEISFTTDPAELDDRRGEPAPTRESLLAWLRDALVLEVDTEGKGQPDGAVFASAGVDWDAVTLIEGSDHLG